MGSVSAKWFSISLPLRSTFTLWLTGDLVDSVEQNGCGKEMLPLCIRTTGLWIEPGCLAQGGVG